MTKQLKMANSVAVIVSKVANKEHACGYSFESQQEFARAYCKVHHIPIVSEFTLYGNDELDYPTLDSLFDFVRNSKVPVILIVDRANRLYRNMEDWYIYNELVQNYDVSIFYVAENVLIDKNLEDNLAEIYHESLFCKVS